MDAERRAAARRSEASGDVADRARLLQARLRAGELLREQVELLAFVGDPAAASIVEVGPLPEYPVSVGTGERPRPGHWQLGHGEPRELGLWVDELGMRFGALVGVRAAWLAVRHAVLRPGGAANARTRLLDALEGWLAEPNVTTLHACEQPNRGLRARGEANDHWACRRLYEAAARATVGEGATADTVFAVDSAARHLVGQGQERAAVDDALRAAVRAGLVPWAEATREVVRDAAALAARARLILRSDPRAAVELATRALAQPRADRGARRRTDPALLLVRADALRAAGDPAAALADLDAALAIDDRTTDALRLRGHVHAALGLAADEAGRAVHERKAVVNLRAYLDRVLVQVTTPTEGTRLVGPPGSDEARTLFARLTGADYRSPD